MGYLLLDLGLCLGLSSIDAVHVDDNFRKKNLHSRAIQRLQALCRYTGRLPPSCDLGRNIILYSRSPISSSALSDVYKGTMLDDDVAIKVLRIHEDNRTEVRRVSRSPSRVPLFYAKDATDVL